MDREDKQQISLLLHNLIRDYTETIKKMPKKTEIEKINLNMMKNTLALLMLLDLIVAATEETVKIGDEETLH